MQLNEHSLIAPSKDKNGRCERSGDGEDGVHVPGASAESVPSETNDANDHVGDEYAGQSEEDVVCRRSVYLTISMRLTHLLRDPSLCNLGTIPSRAEANAVATLQ